MSLATTQPAILELAPTRTGNDILCSGRFGNVYSLTTPAEQVKSSCVYFVFCDLLSSGCYNKAEGGIKVMDIRSTIINNVLLAVQSLLDDQQLQAVQDALCIQLNSYEVQERSTELTVVDNTPDSMLAKYIATKRIEGKAESTIKRYYDTCYMMIHEICKPLHEITTYDLRYYLAVYKEQRKISNRTLDGMRRCFSSFFS